MMEQHEEEDFQTYQNYLKSDFLLKKMSHISVAQDGN